MPPHKKNVPAKPKWSPIRVSARIAIRTVKQTEPLNLQKATTAIDCTQDKVTPESPLSNQNSESLAIMGSFHTWDERSIQSKIEDFQQNPKLVDIMDKILEKHKERYILASEKKSHKVAI